MSFPTPVQWLLLDGIVPAVVLVVVTAAVIVVAAARRTRRRRSTPAAAGAGRTAEVPAGTSGRAAASPRREPVPTRTVADAVRRTLDAREARGADVRDRLLAVLLDDPVRAVGATVELDTCRRQLERLTGAVEHERSVLRGVLPRLAAAGLADEQLARLAGLPVGEVHDLLGEGRAAPGRAGSARDALQPR